MFGESDSESPRIPSPWDSLSPPPTSPPTHNPIPKLVPEADEGNVEYKLQLLSPSTARFARLVTQLKWRLLEGGGQAYYELGVADSGMLVGLPRQQLEESLETLEMMADEIGASVIVVKEIEVPPELSSLAESQIERWDGKRSTRRKDLLRMMKHDEPSPTDLETELSNPDVTDSEDTTGYSPTTPPVSAGGEFILTQPYPSPNLLPFDPALAIFTMDIGTEDVANDADNEAPDDSVPTDYPTDFSISIEISSVYKPRPIKKRARYIPSLLPTLPEQVVKAKKNGYSPSHPNLHTGDSLAQVSSESHPQTMGGQSQHRRDRREKRRDLKLSPLLTHVDTHRPKSSTLPVDHPTVSSSSASDESNTSTLLESLQIAAVDPPIGTSTAASKEPRLIVEVLVVRKLSLDEAFLDFEGFSLQ